MFVGGITEIGYKAPIKRYKRVIPTKNIRYTPEGRPQYKIWDNHKAIGEYIYKGTQKIVVALAARNGEKYLELRVFYCPKDKPDLWLATKQGIIIPLHINPKGVEARPVEGLEKLIAQAMASYDDFPIYDPDGEIYTYKKRTLKRRRKKK